MATNLDSMPPDQRAALEAAMSGAADRFESGEFAGPSPEFKELGDLSPEKQLARARYLRARDAEARAATDAATARAVAAARRQNMSWRTIGGMLGVSDEFARKKFGEQAAA